MAQAQIVLPQRLKKPAAADEAREEAKAAAEKAKLEVQKEQMEREEEVNDARAMEELLQKSASATAACAATLEHCRAQTPKEDTSKAPCQERHQQCLVDAKAAAEHAAKALEHAKALAKEQARLRVKAHEEADADVVAAREGCATKLESCKEAPGEPVLSACQAVYRVCMRHAQAKEHLEASKRVTEADKEAVANSAAAASSSSLP